MSSWSISAWETVSSRVCGTFLISTPIPKLAIKVAEYDSRHQNGSAVSTAFSWMRMASWVFKCNTGMARPFTHSFLGLTADHFRVQWIGRRSQIEFSSTEKYTLSIGNHVLRVTLNSYYLVHFSNFGSCLPSTHCEYIRTRTNNYSGHFNVPLMANARPCLSKGLNSTVNCTQIWRTIKINIYSFPWYHARFLQWQTWASWQPSPPPPWSSPHGWPT